MIRSQISALVKEAEKSLLPLLPGEDTTEQLAVCNREERHIVTLTLDVQPSEL